MRTPVEAGLVTIAVAVAESKYFWDSISNLPIERLNGPLHSYHQKTLPRLYKYSYLHIVFLVYAPEFLGACRKDWF